MEIHPALDARSYVRMCSNELRSAFLLSDLFQPGKLLLRYWETDRAVIGGAIPTRGKLTLGTARELASGYFCERRELGVVNVGEEGVVEVDGVRFSLGKLDCLYVGRGARRVVFSSKRASKPACFYLLSYPAHAAYPTTLARHDDIKGASIGSSATSNGRTIYKFIHADGIKSCQLVMGLTLLEPGSIWNTMPPHTHTRRSEVYFYFDVPKEAAVFHFLGRPDETRHLVVRDREVALSPPWSIHSGAGTANYGFVWGMGGENQDFADMDPAPLAQLR
ncbi:MAG: 5-dehydro-4-deoxy-D-glucuronate isomerase [Candidatus Didemnitutus sp.]|nr:5-dehydro-4-deoxy-D-glucuronate isomerase [Candidatus Didemnitutus sp.]